MMEGFERKEKRERDEVFSRAIRAGKRTYFFDVKKTRGEDMYLTITESKKEFNSNDGRYYFKKHKIFLYKEDFEKFAKGLSDVVEYIKTGKIPEDYNLESVEEFGDEQNSEIEGESEFNGIEDEEK